MVVVVVVVCQWMWPVTEVRRAVVYACAWESSFFGRALACVRAHAYGILTERGRHGGGGHGHSTESVVLGRCLLAEDVCIF